MTKPVHLQLEARNLLIPGHGVRAVPHLQAFLPEIETIQLAGRPSNTTQAIAGWGHKPTARRARELARKSALPYVALEDGFLRSVGLGEAGAPPLSLVADDLGIYYDARGPSRLERLLEDGGWQNDVLIERARQASKRIVDAGLSKTNSAPPLSHGALAEKTRRRILIVDQTLGDASIEGGLASTDTFALMLAAARRDEPEAELIVRRHPAVAAGLKPGCIPADQYSDLRLLDVDARAADIIADVDSVYCVTSLMGFEALLQDKEVRCFGMPFYAGWGATRDEISCHRRTAARSVSEIAAAALLLYSRYINPITGQPTTLEATIDRLIEWRSVADENAGHISAVGFTAWKRATIRNMLSGPRTTMDFHRSPQAGLKSARSNNGRVVIWAGKEDSSTRRVFEASDQSIWRMEDGFLRSRGLGSDFHLPASIVVDDTGIYFDQTRPSAHEEHCETAEITPALAQRARRLIDNLVASGLSKYNVGGPSEIDFGTGKPSILVVGQVEDDRSIELGTTDISTNLGLLEAVRRDHPDSHVFYKPHPDVETGNRVGRIDPAVLATLSDGVLQNADIATCIDQCDALATMTSLAGFEALMRGKTVYTYGGPFYAGWGLTVDALRFERRTRRLSIDELAAVTLILYPRYIHPPTGLPCTPEEIVSWLANQAPAPGSKRWRWFRALWSSLSGTRPTRY